MVVGGSSCGIVVRLNPTWPLHNSASTNDVWWHTKKRWRGGHILRNCRAIVLQWCGAMRVGGGQQRMIDLCTTAST